MKKIRDFTAMAKSAIALTFILLTIVFESCAQTRFEKIDMLASAYSAYGNFNGAILVADHGEVIYKKAFGMANMEWNIPNQPDTKFRLASITKQFTAMLVMQLVAADKLELNVPISSFLPDYPKATGDVITIHHLLTHTSGIPNFTSFPSYRETMVKPHRPEELVRLFANEPLEFVPGEQFAYSNSGYILLGYIIEKITGKTYEQVIQDQIFGPLHMKHSGYDHTQSLLPDRASGYERLGTSFQNANYIDMSVPFAAGGLYSTVEDMYLWDQALYTEKLLPKKFLDLLFEKYIPAYGGRFYGYGWDIGEMPIGNTTEKTGTVAHSGGINGFSTLITRIPSDHASIILLNNTGGAPLYEMTLAITGILYDKTYDLPKKSTAKTLSLKIEKEGLPATIAFYQAIKNSADYHLDENEMNGTGYQWLQSGHAAEAAALFKINVDAFPNSFNVYDSYGEALLALGDTTGAIENYRWSLKLNPGSESGINALKKMGVSTDDLIKKVPLEELQALAGEYVAVDSPAGNAWKIVFTVENGVLYGNDKGYRYKALPVGENQFVNPDDGASLVFDTIKKDAITLTLFGRYLFRKVK